MSRLPAVNGDNGTWGTILNDYLSVVHSTSGLLNSGVIATTNIIDANVTTAKLELSVQTSLSKANTALQTVAKSDVGLSNVTNIGILSLGPSDAIPGGTVAGTIILRTT